MDESSFLSPAAAVVAEHVTRPSHELGPANDELQQARGLVEVGPRRSRSGRSGVRRAEDEVRALLRENSTLRAENATLQQLCIEYITAKEQLARLRSAAGGDLRQTGMDAPEESRNAPHATQPGTDDRGAMLEVRDASPQAGGEDDPKDHRAHDCPGAQHQAMVGRGSRPRVRRRTSTRPMVIQSLRRPLTTFHDLPWRRLGEPVFVGGIPRGYYKILLIAPGEDNPGELADMLRFAEGLSRCGDLDCRIVLDGRSDLSDAFARIIPTLELERAARARDLATRRRR